MMQEDQEQRFVCRFCDKSFVGGNCLGGHMRRHLDLISAERCDENCNGGLGYEEEVLNNGNKVSVSSEDYLLDGGYGLRVNPKKSWRFSDLENGGKGFRSVRALSVHRRGHLINGRDENAICKECGKSFGSMKAVFGHMRCHSKKDLVSTELYSQLVSPVRKKRSRTWYSRMIPNMESCSDVNASSSTTATEIDEVKGAAICLMMISRGYEGGLVAEVDFFLENDDLEKLRLSKKRKLVDQDSELDGNLCDRYLHSASNGSEILRNSDSKHEFKCKTSDRVFCSNQALGRHQSVHKTSDSCTQLETCSKLTQTTLLSVPVVNSELEKLEGVKNQLENKHGVETRNCNSKKSSYKCSTCFKVFKSGQALGGHKRAHYFGQKESSVNEPCC